MLCTYIHTSIHVLYLYIYTHNYIYIHIYYYIYIVLQEENFWPCNPCHRNRRQWKLTGLIPDKVVQREEEGFLRYIRKKRGIREQVGPLINGKDDEIGGD